MHARQAFEAGAELVAYELNVLWDVFVSPLPSGQVLGKRQEPGNEHSGQVCLRCLGNEVLIGREAGAQKPTEHDTYPESRYNDTDDLLLGGALCDVN